ncbi:hypothetical protein [Parablautia muri]|uniref:Uncharacterized protein n=1 Tax=Parablautia muri TaxID=2320879 RepID=A0A9X5GSX2_9FIRM|nr:hypothetical protein [Parablautia muri]NBJ94448.1 hypothetical protein [Parablautia muri]
MCRITGLSRQYVQIRRNKSGEITYGGDQNFFAGAPAGSRDARKQRIGCGVTAFGDMLLYLGGSSQAYCTRENKNYINRILSEEEYKVYYNLIYNFLGQISARANKGLSGIRLWSRFNRLSRREQWKLRGKWGLSGRKLYGRIVEMLDHDIPVIMCVPVLLGKNNKGQGLIFYQKENGVYHKKCTVTAHYVIIAELVEENGRIYFGISSWGKKYYVDREEYELLIRKHFLGTILGNILYIRQKAD